MTDSGQPIEDLGDAVKHLRNMIDMLLDGDELSCASCVGTGVCRDCPYYTSYTEAVEFLKANGGVK